MKTSEVIKGLTRDEARAVPVTGDSFTIRRSGNGAGNPYDPESLLTGAEIAQGLGYQDQRDWPNTDTYIRAVNGDIGPTDVARIAPRRKWFTPRMSYWELRQLTGLEDDPPAGEGTYKGRYYDRHNDEV